MKKQNKAEKEIDKRIDRAYRKTCSGITINIPDIGKIFAFGKMKIEAGETDAELESSIFHYAQTLRVAG